MPSRRNGRQRVIGLHVSGETRLFMPVRQRRAHRPLNNIAHSVAYMQVQSMQSCSSSVARRIADKTACCAATDFEEGTFTRTAPEGIAVLDIEEVLPNSATFTAYWHFAEKMVAWPADKKSPSTETQVRTQCSALYNGSRLRAIDRIAWLRVVGQSTQSTALDLSTLWALKWSDH